MIGKRFFLSNLLKKHLSFTFALTQNSALFVKSNPQKTEKIDVFKYSCLYGIYSKEILMQLIKSFVNINLKKMSIFCAIESFGHESSTSCKYILQNIYEKLEQI